MPVISFLPSGKTIAADKGALLADAMRALGLHIPAPCGGKGLCGKCRVRIVHGDAPVDSRQRSCLSGDLLAAGWRAACAFHVESDLVVADPGPDDFDQAILVDFLAREVRGESGFWERKLALELPSPADQRSDKDRLLQALAKTGIGDGANAPETPLPLLRRLPALLRENGFVCRVVGLGDRIIDIRPAGDASPVTGLAVDIGTTTIAAVLCDLASRRILASASSANPQAARGDDVISRIDYASRGDGELEELRRLVLDAVCALAEEARGKAGLDAGPAVLTIAGNTVMNHLFLGAPPRALALAPFIPVFAAVGFLDGGASGLPGKTPPWMYVAPGISAYVGGDITAGLLAHDVHRSEGAVLFLDVGTNGEMALSVNGVVHACATAAGPAFEGARISQGMRAVPGAIARVGLTPAGELEIGTIDSVFPPLGLCGTGILDAVATLVRAGIVDETGRLLDGGEARENRPEISLDLLSRIQERENGPAFRLDDGSAEGVYLTQADIREFQLAKGAVAAGCRVLLDTFGLSAEDVSQALLAGGFGNYLDPNSALAVGMLPRGIDPRRIRSVGNASLAGARLCLLSRSERADIEAIPRAVKYIELSGREDFQVFFAEEMLFGEL